MHTFRNEKIQLSIINWFVYKFIVVGYAFLIFVHNLTLLLLLLLFM